MSHGGAKSPEAKMSVTSAASLGMARAASAEMQQNAGSSVSFDQVCVAYKGVVVLKPLTLNVAAGEILALIGPSGSGKTTALRAVAGFVRPVSGRIMIGATDVTDLPPYERGLGMVVQNYALFPHMRVEDNVAFGLRARGADKALIADRVTEALRVVGMSAYVGRYPRELSGGQQQRIAIARALAVRPKVLLLDEPLSALDAQIRRSMVEEIASLHRNMPDLTILYVTHDQSEALTLADKIAIMKDGMLSAHGATNELYRHPPNRFAAEFLGRANLLPVTPSDPGTTGGYASVTLGSSRLLAPAKADLPRNKCLLCVRPQNVTLTPESASTNRLSGNLTDIHWQGELTHLVLEIAGTAFRVVTTRAPANLQIGRPVDLFFAHDDSSLIAEDEHG
ncbi:ATP-binding cassette domain-containing protein [Methylovirgula sp. 4M-Z18]|nr:ATP-binding cassette domain-containing protein [Methylovirgula sp. 4M-Z18]